VVLSVTIKEASAGTEMVEAMGKAEPPNAAAEKMLTVMSAADVPSTLAIKIEFILKTLPLDAALDASCVALVPTAIESVLPIMLVTLIMLGFAIMFP
jgi:hypothetical protein